MARTAPKPKISAYQPKPDRGYTACPINFVEGNQWLSHKEHTRDKRRFYHVVLGGKHGSAALYADSNTYKTGMRHSEDGLEPEHFVTKVDAIDVWLTDRCRKEHGTCRVRNGLEFSAQPLKRAKRAAASDAKPTQPPPYDRDDEPDWIELAKGPKCTNVKAFDTLIKKTLAEQANKKTEVKNGEEQDAMSDVEENGGKADEKGQGVGRTQGNWLDTMWWIFGGDERCITRDRDIVDEELNAGRDVFCRKTFSDAIDTMKTQLGLEEEQKVYVVARNGLVTSDRTRACQNYVKTVEVKGSPTVARRLVNSPLPRLEAQGPTSLAALKEGSLVIPWSDTEFLHLLRDEGRCELEGKRLDGTTISQLRGSGENAPRASDKYALFAAFSLPASRRLLRLGERVGPAGERRISNAEPRAVACGVAKAWIDVTVAIGFSVTLFIIHTSEANSINHFSNPGTWLRLVPGGTALPREQAGASAGIERGGPLDWLVREDPRDNTGAVVLVGVKESMVTLDVIERRLVGTSRALTEIHGLELAFPFLAPFLRTIGKKVATFFFAFYGPDPASDTAQALPESSLYLPRYTQAPRKQELNPFTGNRSRDPEPEPYGFWRYILQLSLLDLSRERKASYPRSPPASHLNPAPHNSTDPGGSLTGFRLYYTSDPVNLLGKPENDTSASTHRISIMPKVTSKKKKGSHPYAYKPRAVVTPPPSAELSVNNQIRVFHYAYDPPLKFLALTACPLDPTLPEDDQLFELPRDLVEDACQILANNLQGSLWSFDRQQLSQPEKVKKHWIKPGDYRSLSETYDEDTEMLGFRQWQPPSEVPAKWKTKHQTGGSGKGSQFARHTDGQCLFTGWTNPLDGAHLVPVAEEGWLFSNDFDTVVKSQKGGINSAENIITVRSDLNARVLDQGHFVLFPMAQQWITFWIGEDSPEMAYLINFREVQLPGRINGGYLWARFALNIFLTAKQFLSVLKKLTSQKVEFVDGDDSEQDTNSKLEDNEDDHNMDGDDTGGPDDDDDMDDDNNDDEDGGGGQGSGRQQGGGGGGQGSGRQQGGGRGGGGGGQGGGDPPAPGRVLRERPIKQTAGQKKKRQTKMRQAGSSEWSAGSSEWSAGPSKSSGCWGPEDIEAWRDAADCPVWDERLVLSDGGNVDDDPTVVSMGSRRSRYKTYFKDDRPDLSELVPSRFRGIEQIEPWMSAGAFDTMLAWEARRPAPEIVFNWVANHPVSMHPGGASVAMVSDRME
ncbi:hypothetical protein C8R43DRAFT_952222 [Mycena crocata]|nr:hypothetical protein C8R43DRAFT_952222 [Mycena crocata]